MRRLRALILASTLLQVIAVPAALADAKRAVELYEESRAHYQAGRFQEAIALLKEAYALDHNPDLLYNMARSYEGLGDFDGAANAYESYLRAAPDIPDRGSIETRIKTLRAKAKPSPEPAPPRPARELLAAPADDSVLRGPLPWVVTAIGAASLVAGAILRGAAFAEHASAVDERTQRDATDRQSLAVDLQTASTVSFAVGGGVSVVGLTLGIVGLATAPEPETAAWLRLGGSF